MHYLCQNGSEDLECTKSYRQTLSLEGLSFLLLLFDFSGNQKEFSNDLCYLSCKGDTQD